MRRARASDCSHGTETACGRDALTRLSARSILHGYNAGACILTGRCMILIPLISGPSILGGKYASIDHTLSVGGSIMKMHLPTA